MRSALIVFFLCWSMNGSSQNNGFMGKKFTLSANLLANTNFFLIPVDIDPGRENPVRYFLDPKCSFAADYVTGRRTAIGARAELNRFMYDAEVHVYDPMTQQSLVSGWTILDLKVDNLGLSLKRFSESSIAPLGLYWQIDAGYMKYSLIDKEAVTGIKNRDILGRKGFYTAFTIGRQQMLMRNLIFNAGVELRYCSVFFPVTANQTDDGYYTLPDGKRVSLDYYLTERLVKAYILNARLGLGYMLF